jgi:hypothetical protein
MVTIYSAIIQDYLQGGISSGIIFLSEEGVR